MQCLKAMYWPTLKGRGSIFDLKILLAIFICKQSFTVLLSQYCPTIHSSISKIWPKFQVLRSMSCSMSIQRKLCAVKIFQLQSMSNATRSINQRLAFKNSGISCMALIFNLNNPRTTILHAKDTSSHEREKFCFFQFVDANLWLSG